MKRPVCLNMDRVNEDYCLLVCDAVYDSNFFLRDSFIETRDWGMAKKIQL